MAKLLKGAPVAKALSEQVKDRVSRLKAKGVKPTLAIVRVGEQGSDIAYERGVVKRCEKNRCSSETFYSTGKLFPAKAAGCNP